MRFCSKEQYWCGGCTLGSNFCGPLPYLVYSEKVKTSSVYIRGSTSISDYALLMFGGNLIPSKNGDVIEMLDVYLQFSASKSVLGLIKVRFCVRYGDMGGMSNG
ncbi:hypothetical protein Hanom_Chr02g00108851 [Helianthus anomalus]